MTAYVMLSLMENGPMLKLLLAASTLLTPIPAMAETYTLLIYETPADLALRTAHSSESAAYWDAYAGYGKAMQTAGVARGGAALHAEAADQPLTLSGYFTIEAPTLDAARGWAAKAPASTRGGTVEVRRNFPAPTM